MSATWRDRMVIGAACAGSFVVYALTVAPTVLGRDTGEFITATWVLGVVHPTGYPLYMLLGRLFEILIPFGEIALRLNLASVVFAAAGAALVAWVYMRAGGGRIAALLAALSSSFMALVWSQAIVADKYALNGLLVMAGVAAFVAWHRRRTPRRLVALCALAGVATIAHHRTAGLALGPFVAAGLLLQRPVSWKVLAKAVGALLAAFAFYLYLPIRSAVFPPASWTNILSWPDLARFLAGADWASHVFHRRGAEMWGFIGYGAGALRHDVSLIGIALAALGWGVLALRYRVFWICSTLGFLLAAAWAATYDVWNASVYFLPCYLFFGMWLAVGVEAVARSAARIWKNAGARLLAARALVAVALVAIPGKELIASWGEVGLRNHCGVKERGEVILANTPPGARMLIRGHAVYTTLLYLTLVENERPDLLLVSSGLLGNLWYQVGIPDRTVRLAAEDTMVATLRREIHRAQDFSPHVASRLLAHQADSRPLVTNFQVLDLPGGYWHKGLPADMVQITNEPPPAPQSARPPAGGSATFPLGLELAGSEVKPSRLRPGELFTLDLYWRPAAPVEQLLLVEAALEPRGRKPPRRAQPQAAQQPFVTEEGKPLELTGAGPAEIGFAFWFPLEYASLPLNALGPGQTYRQTVKLIASRALPAGPCDLRLRVASEAAISAPATIATLTIAGEQR
jgi:hypothetical protein